MNGQGGIVESLKAAKARSVEGATQRDQLRVKAERIVIESLVRPFFAPASDGVEPRFFQQLSESAETTMAFGSGRLGSSLDGTFPISYLSPVAAGLSGRGAGEGQVSFYLDLEKEQLKLSFGFDRLTRQFLGDQTRTAAELTALIDAPASHDPEIEARRFAAAMTAIFGYTAINSIVTTGTSSAGTLSTLAGAIAHQCGGPAKSAVAAFLQKSETPQLVVHVPLPGIREILTEA